MADIVERLRGPAPLHWEAKEAADEITALRAENERLRAALLPFASVEADNGDGFSGLPDMVIIRIEASVRELKAARAALEGK